MRNYRATFTCSVIADGLGQVSGLMAIKALREILADLCDEEATNLLFDGCDEWPKPKPKFAKGVQHQHIYQPRLVCECGAVHPWRGHLDQITEAAEAFCPNCAQGHIMMIGDRDGKSCREMHCERPAKRATMPQDASKQKTRPTTFVGSKKSLAKKCAKEE